MRTVSFRLPARLDRALNELVRRRGSNRSALVREALEALARSKRCSVTAEVNALVGALDGPPDLSTNPKQLARYGK